VNVNPDLGLNSKHRGKYDGHEVGYINTRLDMFDTYFDKIDEMMDRREDRVNQIECH